MGRRDETPGSEIAAVLLAAGESRRMGAANKLLLPLAGEPLVRRSARTLLESRLAEIVVVLGHQREAVARALDGLAIAIVVNPRYRDGQMTSVHAGIAALTVPADGVMICLADQPSLVPADIDALIAAFTARGSKSIVVPTHRGRRGNPIILAAAHRDDILARQANLGCRQLIDRNPDLVFAVEMACDHFVCDIDTAEDYRALASAAES